MKKRIIYAIILVAVITVALILFLPRNNLESESIIIENKLAPLPLEKQTNYPSRTLTPNETWRFRESLIGKTVAVKGTPEISWACTDMTGDNSCSGPFFFNLDTGGIEIGLWDGEYTRASCTVTLNAENKKLTNLRCRLFELGQEYTFVGTLVDWAVYTPLINVTKVYDSNNSQIYQKAIEGVRDRNKTWDNSIGANRCNSDNECELITSYSCCARGDLTRCTHKNDDKVFEYEFTCLNSTGCLAWIYNSDKSCKCVNGYCMGR